MTSAEHKSKSGLKHVFKKEPSESVDLHRKPSGHGLSKLFHHHHNHQALNSNHSSDTESHLRLSRAPSKLSLRRHNSQSHTKPEEKHHVKLSKAETMAHLQHMNHRNHKNAAAIEERKAQDTPDANLDQNNHPHEKMVYNPFGINKDLIVEKPKDSSFYMAKSDDGRILSNPVKDPNELLPADLQQEKINLLEDFEVDTEKNKLGVGGSSDVRIINLILNKRKVFALKRFTLLEKETDDDFYKRVVKEYLISKKAKGRHVVNTYSIVRIQSLNNLSRGWGFVLEFCQGGDLFNLIVKPGWKRTSLNERYCIFKQISYGLKFLHDKDIVHKDMKPENILIDRNGVAKICDFGVSDWGHETPGDFSTPIKLSTAYVGSPPYSPPEVMKLKEVSHSDAKNWAYDPFKMDCWGLGMLLFCIVYCGVPFGTSTTNDHAYRDYKFFHQRFISDNPGFKSNTDFHKGPGPEYKWAREFQSTGASRVAWKLCHPSVSCRYTTELLFNDPWFNSLEMCMYEDEDPQANGVIYVSQGTNSSFSNFPSTTTSRAPSRHNTGSHHHYTAGTSADLATTFKSMLDIGDAKPDTDDDTRSIRSASSLTASNVAKSNSQKSNSNGDSSPIENCCDCVSLPKTRSMLDITERPKVKSMLDLANSPNLPSLKENETQDSVPLDQSDSSGKESSGDNCECQCHETPKTNNRPRAQSHPHPLRTKSTDSFGNANNDLAKTTRTNSFYEDDEELEIPDVHLDSNGACDLGYRIKKHHHLDISGAAVQGSVSRRR